MTCDTRRARNLFDFCVSSLHLRGLKECAHIGKGTNRGSLEKRVAIAVGIPEVTAGSQFWINTRVCVSSTKPPKMPSVDTKLRIKTILTLTAGRKANGRA